MHSLVRPLSSLLPLMLALSLGAADAPADQQRADQRAAQQQVMGLLQELGTSDDQAAVYAAVVARFPEAQRTPAQALVLGDMLYDVDPAQSYAFHAAAAKGLPQHAQAQMELALEQHRRGEYAAAIATYDRYLEMNPDFAPGLGMSACCAIAAGDLHDAVARWQRSERSRNGTLHNLESLMCAVMYRPTAIEQRIALRAKAVAGDGDDVVRLVGHDLAFRHDWWNSGPHPRFLAADRALLPRIADARRRAEVAAAIGLALINDGDPEQPPTAAEVRTALGGLAAGVAAGSLLPGDGPIAEFILSRLLDAKVVDQATVRTACAAQIAQRCAATADPSWYNLRAHLFAGSAEDGIVQEREAWKATGDVRFALGALLQVGPAAAADPLLAEALARHPFNAELQALKLTTAGAAPDAAALTAAIIAECHGFSRDPLSMVPTARPLRRYFAQLAKLAP